MIRRGAGWLALAGVVLCLPSVAPAQALPNPAVAAPVAPAQTLEAIAAVPTGRVGIAAIDLATGREVAVHGSENFPLASVVKIAVAAAYLSEVDAGRRSLARSITLDEKTRSGSDGIGRLMPHPGVTLSAANLIELMLTVSDNTATDMLIADLGGTRAVQRWLTRNRVAGVRIDREIARLVLDNLGLPMLPGKTAAQTLWASDPLTVEARTVAIASFDIDPRDSASPLAIARFLVRLDQGQLLTPASSSFLFEVMARCRTGADRIPAGLPEGTPVAHKTGTLAGISNDVGIVTLPDKRRIAIAVFTRGIAEGPARARIIADATRMLFAQHSTL
ncbi:MAG: class A beta-lactamase [Sphingomonas bacterium]|nr:class A beta-lactamase [Sphingomonas bacterium]